MGIPQAVKAQAQNPCAKLGQDPPGPMAPSRAPSRSRYVAAVLLLAVCGLLHAASVAGGPRPPPAFPSSFSGRPSSISDGDTLTVNGYRVRMHGIDAPEKAQMCGNASGALYLCGIVSRDALIAKVGSQSIRCDVKDKDFYGRFVAVCSLLSSSGAVTEDLNRWMVQQGYAVAYREYSRDYVAVEDEAKAAKRGIWAGTFQYPAQWRREEDSGRHAPLPPLPPLQPPGVPNCGPGVLPIKGNINSSGEKIYHVPGSASYDRTVIDLSKGERYFCTAAEAEAAGFRRAGTGKRRH